MSSTRLLRLRSSSRRIAVEPRPGELLWAESVWMPGGPVIIDCGRETCHEDEEQDAFLRRLAREPWLRTAQVSLVIRHPDMVVQRIELPILSNRDAKRIGKRKARELMLSVSEPSSWGFTLSPGKRPRPAWITACPEEFTSFVERRWRDQGFPVSHFGNYQLAIAALTRALPEPRNDSLRAFLDIASDHAVCVVADKEGWVFGREIPIKIAGAAKAGPEEADPVERLATELQRTFRYVATEQAAGTVTELTVSGTREELGSLAAALTEQLEFEVNLIGDAISEGPAAGADPELGSVIGLALESRLGASNLLPHLVQRKFARRRTTRLLAIAAALPALLLAVGVARATWQLSALKAQSDLIENEWEERGETRLLAEAAERERSHANDLAAAKQAISLPQPAWSMLLHSLGVLLPDDSFVTAFEAGRTEEEWLAVLRLEFRGDDLASAAEAGSLFAEALDQSPLWSIERIVPEKRSRRSGIGSESQFARARFRVEALLAPVRSSDTEGSPLVSGETGAGVPESASGDPRG